MIKWSDANWPPSQEYMAENFDWIDRVFYTGFWVVLVFMMPIMVMLEIVHILANVIPIRRHHQSRKP
jgi:hypothetical protein